ncbi:hypothetical protein [Desulfosporosinus hippei]|uniref:Uncharacterized protein n=1 Tax=Desulfosporosinus hippei DSM 8344 TaxID=1121419 RepID=A0A1G8EUH0_9FIRM|nr:hypothetical protein [Desulfosporosinus hippei]SDH73495.1 hypothetical protein SAMN05443529_1183 [Desulfosporosinus hippei DSM 8344]
MNDRNNLSHVKFFGIGIPEEGELATIDNEEEVKRLIRSVKPVELAEMGEGVNPNGNKIVLYLLDGNRTEITAYGQNKVQIAQIINHVSYPQIFIQLELRALLDNLSKSQSS